VDYRSLVLLIGLLTLAAFAGVLYLSQASLAAELQYRLSDAEWQAEDLWERNLALRHEICSAARLATIEARAADLGLVDAPANAIYVACTLSEAELPIGRPPVAPDRAPEARVAESSWQGLLSRLGLVATPEQASSW
jgi:hypothetical protein